MITTDDIRHAYIRLHGLNQNSIKEYERLGLLTADQYSEELLSLPIDEFMIAAGFVADVTPDDAPYKIEPKRAYTKKVK